MLKKKFLVALLATALIFGFIGCDGGGNPGTGGSGSGGNGGGLDYGIGDIGPTGGLVFYYNAEGFTVYRDAEDTVGTICNYLEAAPNDINMPLAWGRTETFSVTGTKNGIGMGKMNTAIILAADEEAPAAKACSDYGDFKDGWYLPSREELKALYQSGKGNFNTIRDTATWTDCYWSSCQEFNIGAWYFRFSTGDQINEYQNKAYSVRPIRAFSEIPEPATMDDYEELEPEMAVNPNRYRVRVGSTVTVTIPSYVSVPSGATVTFAINAGDTSIAQITENNAANCTVKGLAIGSARLTISVNGSARATVIIAVAPKLWFYTLPEVEEETLTGTDINGYKTEPTHQLAWKWKNPPTQSGASGVDCGIDILAYYVDPTTNNTGKWVKTTYGFGGWHYDLNSMTNTMNNGTQTTGNVKLEIKPEFVYDNGVPYLQIVHTLTNIGGTTLTNQKFGASADVMIEGNDRAPLTHLPYGALMTNATTAGSKPTIKLRLVCQGMQAVSNVSTLWMGNYGSERTHIYEDKRADINTGTIPDTALNFSYQGISLNAGESKNFVIRFTQVQ